MIWRCKDGCVSGSDTFSCFVYHRQIALPSTFLVPKLMIPQMHLNCGVLMLAFIVFSALLGTVDVLTKTDGTPLPLAN